MKRIIPIYASLIITLISCENPIKTESSQTIYGESIKPIEPKRSCLSDKKPKYKAGYTFNGEKIIKSTVYSRGPDSCFVSYMVATENRGKDNKIYRINENELIKIIEK